MRKWWFSVTNTGSQLTFMTQNEKVIIFRDPRGVTTDLHNTEWESDDFLWPTRGHNWPFRCLDSNLSTFWNILENVRRERLELLKQNVVNISITNWYTGFDIWKKYKNWHFGKYIKFVFVLYYFVKYVHIHPKFSISGKCVQIDPLLTIF